jgi:glycosyltransferase EpsD
MKRLKEQGYSIHACANGGGDAEGGPPFCDRFFDLPIARSPLGPANAVACLRLKRIIDENRYSLLVCNTSVGGALGRLAAMGARKRGLTRVMYIAHGLYFYKGAPLLNWMAYYPIEKICSRLTDDIVTMNIEDFKNARDRLNAGRTWFFNGMGVDTRRFREAGPDRAGLRGELGVPEDALLLISVGELSRRKNHAAMLKALARVRASGEIPGKGGGIHYAIVGDGPLRDELARMAQSGGIGDIVHFAGRRKNVEDFYAISDIFCFPSYMEGLPASVIEAMAAGLPVICSDIRGNTDLVKQGKGGLLLPPGDVAGYASAMLRLAGDPALRARMGEENMGNAVKYDVSNVAGELAGIFAACLDGAP